MSLDQYTPEQVKEMSMLEVAYEIFLGRKDAISFNELVDEITKALELSKEEVQERVSQFYTDLNIDGRFITLGDNRWGLRTWYPYEQIDEEVIHTEKPKKKKKGKKKDEDDDLLGFDDLDEDDLDFDEDYDEEDEDEDVDDIDDEDEEEDEDFDEVEDDDDFDDDDEELVDDEEFELEDEDEELEEEED